MKVLWFTNTSSLFDDSHPTNGGGWIASLEKEMREVPDIQLAIGFFHTSNEGKVTKNGVIYYPIPQKSRRSNPIRSVIKKWRGDIGNDQLDKLQSIIADFKPDLIHVFGTEGLFSSIQKHTNIPVVIHLQGLMNPIAKAFFAPGFSAKQVLLDPHFFKQNLLGNSLFFQYKRVRNQAIREAGNLKMARFVMGRTAWDKSVTQSFNPSVTYFHVDEILRDVFMRDSLNATRETSDQLVITSTISGTSYKGIDVILRTASLLTKEGLNFKWNLVGIESDHSIYKLFQRKTGVSGNTVNVHCLGVKTAEELVVLLRDTDLFVHPSYIDNSPNSVCEAQLLALPVIACNTGGLSTLIDDEVSGILVPAGDFQTLARRISDFRNNPNKYHEIGKRAREIALERHQPELIKQAVADAYHKITKL